MSLFRNSFEKNIDSATSHLILEPDWPAIILICDEINQKDISPKTAFAAIKKKMNSQNPHTAFYALLVLESVVKNCGTPIHDEVFTKDNCKMFSQFLETTTHENVRSKMLELVQIWANAFRSSDKYQAIKDTMTILKAKGHKFPEMKEADAMFVMSSAPKWADGKVCHRCRTEFTITIRKHHCRNCGQIFCGQCTSQYCPLPKFGIEKEVRVCDVCFAQLQRPISGKSASQLTENDLPAEYLNSSLAQQTQTPPRKSEEELKEEEELELALALSQSEAECKKQQQQQSLAAYRLQQRSPSPEASSTTKELPAEEANTDLAKYLNRTYWEQRKITESPSAPSPMPATPQPQPQLTLSTNDFCPNATDEQKINDFADNMRTQVEMFVNRMKSDSSRGRSITNDNCVQELFVNLTSMHSQLLTYIKEMDDKRMSYEQLQDKLAQIKDSRAALDVLRQEHAEKLRLMAEEQERQRQIQMAQKLEIMRKKKQEYLQYQRELALQRIRDQEREMQLRQEHQMAQYRIGGHTAFPFMGSPSHKMMGAGVYNNYPTAATAVNGNSSGVGGSVGMMPQYNLQMSNAMPGMYAQVHNVQPSQMMPAQMIGHIQGVMPGMLVNEQQLSLTLPSDQMSVRGGPPQQQQQQQQQHIGHVMLQQHQNVLHNQPAIQNMPNAPPAPAPPLTPPQTAAVMSTTQNQVMTSQQQQQQQQQIFQNQNQNQIPQQQQQQQQHQLQQEHQQEPQQQQQSSITSIAANQIQAVNAAPAPPQQEPQPIPAAPKEPATAELISFD